METITAEALRTRLEQDVLLKVRRPSRYLGSEVNSVHKNPDDVELRIALAFPDLYDLGLGNLGLHILYAILNDLPWCWAERAYAPAPDMADALRAENLPLFTNESKSALGSLDMVGFSLQSELTYTSVLLMLDLAGIPFRSDERDETYPLIFAGGPTVVNPEPMAPFMDFFVVGEAEEAVVEVAEVVRAHKGQPRDKVLAALESVPGVYVPSRYPMDTLDDGRIVPAEDGPKITRRYIPKMDAAKFPTRYIVPFCQLIHDRVGLEIMRGCTHGCRFCQAGATTRPVRERSLETIAELMKESLDNTGYEEVSLVSLSTCDYSSARKLIAQSGRLAHGRDVSVSVPSLRLDSFSVDLADAVSGVRRSGLTFAPEAATPRLRAVINKWIPDEELLHAAEEAYRRGWAHVKCYFMIGLPTERDEDVEAIVDLCRRTLEMGKRITKKAGVHTGISTFVPKPFTPFQWAEQINLDEMRRRQAILAEGFKTLHGVKYGRHEVETSYIEGLLARADRRAADLIESAYRHGACLDSSSEYLKFSAWQEAVTDTHYDVKAMFAERALDARLPWDHIDVLVPKSWFQADYQRALAGEYMDDCRYSGCNQCGVMERDGAVCTTMLERMREGEHIDENVVTHGFPQSVEPDPMQRLRFRIGRLGESRFLSNHEWMAAWNRALRRTDAPLSYSQGFHAHPKVTFSTAPPVGEESEADYMDILLRRRIRPDELLNQLRDVLPPDFRVYEVEDVPVRSDSLMSLVTGFGYLFTPVTPPEDLEERVAHIMEAETLPVRREGRPTGRRRNRGTKELDLRPMLRHMAVRDGAINVETCVSEGRLPKPREILELLDLDVYHTDILKTKTFLG